MSLSLADGSDADLIARALAGRQDAYRGLLARHRDRIFRLISATTGDPSEALDITQEAFISAFAALDRYDPTRSFEVWLKRIALNKCRDWARRRKVRSFFTRAVPLDRAFAVTDETVPPDIEVADRAELAQVVEAIGKLPARLREVLVLRAVDGLSQAEAGAVLSISGKAVETRLYRARARLKESLRDSR